MVGPVLAGYSFTAGRSPMLPKQFLKVQKTFPSKPNGLKKVI